ncbi:MAG TPA: hypothetical protein VIC71_04280 [Gammaproteobacteria bacterium]
MSPRHPLLYVAYLALACRLAIPAGFMPAPLADGGPLRLCLGGPAGAFLEALATQAHASGEHHAQHHHHGHDDNNGGSPNQHDSWEYCPVGAVFASAALVGESSVVVLDLEHFFVDQPTRILVSSSRAGAYRARAPPLA